MKPEPSIIEIAGPAGSGKTTLCEQLYRYRNLVVRGRRLQPDRLADWPFFIVNGLKVLPQLSARRRGDRRFLSDEIKKMIVLNGWHKVLCRQITASSATTLLDQGPVFSLAILNGLGPKRLKQASFRSWWDRMFQQWANVLGLIVWLDAPDDVLLARIRYRDKPHEAKFVSQEAAVSYLAAYRESFSYVMEQLVSRHPIRVARFDTNEQSTEQIVSAIVALLSSSTRIETGKATGSPLGQADSVVSLPA
jgi:broad-specificity NMP kinase